MGWSAHGLDPETGAVVIMNGDLDTKTPNSNVASPRKRVKREGMLAVGGMRFGNAAALQESADMCMLVSAYGLLSCASADLLQRVAGCCLRRDKSGAIRAVV